MKKILVVDDDENNLLLIKKILNKKLPSYKIILANSGNKGFDMAKKDRPETILLDIVMLDIDGFKICGKLKNDEATKNIPVIMMSALGNDPKVRIQSLNVGADAFISKLFNMNELVALVNVMLRIKETEDLLRTQNKDLETIVSKLKKAEIVQKKNLNQIQQYQTKLKKLNTELLQTEEKERKAIAGYLHDGIGQTLSIAHMQFTSILDDDLNSKTKKKIVEIAKLINSAINDTKLITYDLSPPILYELGLIPAIKWKLKQLEEKTNIVTTLKSKEKRLNLTNDSRILIYRIVCELLFNVTKHADADLINIEIITEGKHHFITVIDNGKGFNYKNKLTLNNPVGYGLFSIKERLESINGRLVLKSDGGSGSSATIIFPV